MTSRFPPSTLASLFRVSAHMSHPFPQMIEWILVNAAFAVLVGPGGCEALNTQPCIDEALIPSSISKYRPSLGDRSWPIRDECRFGVPQLEPVMLSDSDPYACSAMETDRIALGQSLEPQPTERTVRENETSSRICLPTAIVMPSQFSPRIPHLFFASDSMDARST